MAVLISHNLSLEINFIDFDYAGWVQYEVLFKINDQNIIKPDLLKTGNSHWDNRPNNGFKANENEICELIPTLEDVLETNEPDFWLPMEPDITLAIYPDMHFPFLRSHAVQIYEKPEIRKKRLEREQLKQEQKKLPDDPVQFICFVDTHNFAETAGYSGNGVSLHLTVRRANAENFLVDLKRDYEKFQEKFKEEIDKYFEE